MVITSYWPSSFIFGHGALGSTMEAVVHRGLKRPLVISDSNIRRSGLSDRLMEKLPFRAEVFSDFSGEPTVQLAARVAEYVRHGGFDSVIAIGGGSSLDLGKIAALLATNEGWISDYFFAGRKYPSLPKILIPTTAGSGSETSSSAVVKCDDGIKRFVCGADLVADVAIVDLELTTGCPRPVAEKCQRTAGADHNPLSAQANLEEAGNNRADHRHGETENDADKNKLVWVREWRGAQYDDKHDHKNS